MMTEMDFENCFVDQTRGNRKIKRSEYLSKGLLPIIDQGKNKVGGYSNDLNDKVKCITPCIVFGDHSRIVKYLDHDFAIGADGVKVLATTKNVSPKYGYYLLKNVELPITGYDRSFKYLKRALFPVPDLPTQNKIVALLDKASALVQKKEVSIALLDELLRAQFLEMFGDPVFNPKGWKLSQMKTLGFFKNGLNYKQNESGVELLCLGVGDFKGKMQIDDKDSLSALKLDEFPSQEFYLQKGDIVFVRSNGNKKLVGRTIIYLSSRKNVSFSGFCIRFRAESDVVNAQYINQIFRRLNFKKKMLSNGRGANIQNINQLILGNLEIPIPPLDLQNQFENIYLIIRAQKETLIQSKNELDNLYNSLLQRAFSGQLNFDQDVELDALLAAIDLEQDTEKEKYDIKDIATAYAGRLLERIEEQKFETVTQYQQAKQVIYQMLKEGGLEQVYDDESGTVKLKLV